MEYELQAVIEAHITEKLKGRKLRHDTDTPPAQFMYGGSRWTWLTGELETATHEVVGANFSFGRHYCPTDDPYSYDPGEVTYDICLRVRNLSTGKEESREFALDNLPNN